MYSNSYNETVEALAKRVAVAEKREKADLVFKNCTYLNVFTNCFEKGDIAISDKYIVGIGSFKGIKEVDLKGGLVTPGLVDAHIHLENSLVTPVEFARAALKFGTTSVLCDPHEIANVMGKDGIEYMFQATENIGLNVFFMIPSCVPASKYDEGGAVLLAEDIAEFYKNEKVIGLAEVMDFFSVCSGKSEIIQKIADAHNKGKRIDGHAPGLLGNKLNAYIAAGIYSEHESTDLASAMTKLKFGQYIMIREGTAAKNLNALLPLLKNGYSQRCLFASDDKHPNDILKEGHINALVKKAIAAGVDPIIALKVASYNGAAYLNQINRGAIAPGYIADLAVFDNYENMNCQITVCGGKVVYNLMSNIDNPPIEPHLVKKAHSTFNVPTVTAESFKAERLPLIGLIDRQIMTENLGYADKVETENDILKVAVVERHKGSGKIALAYLKNYGLKKGAIATSIAHDSHNIIVVGVDDASMALAVNTIVKNGGGITLTDGIRTESLVLEIAGLMTDSRLLDVNQKLTDLKKSAIAFGVNKRIDPFMSLSFLSLPVVPFLKLTTNGVFDVIQEKYVE